MNNDYAPTPGNVADDFGVAVEMALKARLVFMDCGKWEDTATWREMKTALKSKPSGHYGHNARKVLDDLPCGDAEAVKKLYDDSVEEHRQLPRSRVGERQVKWPNFSRFIEWVGRAVHERYESKAPAIPLPVGGPGVPSFAERLLDWVREPIDQIQSKRTLRETIEVGYKIEETRED